MSYLMWKAKKWKYTIAFKDRIAVFTWVWNSETKIESVTTLRRTCYFNTRQLAFNFNHHPPHGSVVTRDCEPRHLQVPTTISSTAEPRTTDSGRKRITIGCREVELFELFWLTNNTSKCASLRGSWQINSTGKNKQRNKNNNNKKNQKAKPRKPGKQQGYQ